MKIEIVNLKKDIPMKLELFADSKLIQSKCIANQIFNFDVTSKNSMFKIRYNTKKYPKFSYFIMYFFSFVLSSNGNEIFDLLYVYELSIDLNKLNSDIVKIVITGDKILFSTAYFIKRFDKKIEWCDFIVFNILFIIPVFSILCFVLMVIMTGRIDTIVKWVICCVIFILIIGTLLFDYKLVKRIG